MFPTFFVAMGAVYNKKTTANGFSRGFCLLNKNILDINNKRYGYTGTKKDMFM